MSRNRTIDFDLVRGDSFAITLMFFDAAGEPLDVSAWDFAGQVRADPDDAAVLADFAIDDASAEDGIIVCSLAPEDTATFKTRFVNYDIQLTTDQGFVRTAPRGRLNISKDVTHD